jgi:hypothetical protein
MPDGNGGPGRRTQHHSATRCPYASTPGRKCRRLTQHDPQVIARQPNRRKECFLQTKNAENAAPRAQFPLVLVGRSPPTFGRWRVPPQCHTDRVRAEAACSLVSIQGDAAQRKRQRKNPHRGRERQLRVQFCAQTAQVGHEAYYQMPAAKAHGRGFLVCHDALHDAPKA